MRPYLTVAAEKYRISNSRPEIYRVDTIAEVEARQAVKAQSVFKVLPMPRSLGSKRESLERTPGTRACGHRTWPESSDYVRFALFDSTTFPTQSGPLQVPRGHSLKSYAFDIAVLIPYIWRLPRRSAPTS